MLVLQSHNADFDGDEMNMHVPQSIQTSIELRKLARVPSQIISPRMNAPVISPYRILYLVFIESQMMVCTSMNWK